MATPAHTAAAEGIIARLLQARQRPATVTLATDHGELPPTPSTSAGLPAPPVTTMVPLTEVLMLSRSLDKADKQDKALKEAEAAASVETTGEAVRMLLEMEPPVLPAGITRYAYTNAGEMLHARPMPANADKRLLLAEKENNDRWRDMEGLVNHLPHDGNGESLRHQFHGLMKPIQTLEATLKGAILEDDVFNDLLKTRDILQNRLTALLVRVKGTPAAARAYENDQLEGDDALIQKYVMKTGGAKAARGGGGGGNGGGSGRGGSGSRGRYAKRAPSPRRRSRSRDRRDQL